MRKKFAAVVLVAALMLGGAVACAAPADAATISQQSQSCGPFWLRVWLVFTQPTYVGYLVGTQRCGN